MNKTYKYKAFISYSHQDQKFGKWLHKKIENYKIPKSLRPKYPNLPKDLKRTIFIDDEELPTASALPENLSNALESSELLIVICSPSATSSYWVDKELIYFKHKHGEGKILAVLKDGEPNATYSSVYDNDLEAFPKSLRYKVNEDAELTDERTEPLAADARNLSGRKKALIKLIAGILKVDFADLWEREKRETRKRRITYGSLFVVFVAVSIYAFVQFLGEQGNKELEQINSRINMIEYSRRYDELPVAKVIALNKELKKLKVDKENKEASQEALGNLKTSLGKKAQKIYLKEGAKPAIEILTSKSALANQESRLKEISKEKLALAKLYVETYEFEKAKEQYKIAIQLFDDYENASTYGGFLYDNNHFEQAVEVYEKLIKQKLIKSQESSVLNSLALLYSKTNRLKEAEELYNEALKIRKTLSKKNPAEYNPAFAKTLNNLAILYYKTNRLQEAEESYSEALKIRRALVKINPDAYKSGFAKTLNNLAILYYKTNRLQEAEKSYNEEVKIRRALAKTNPAEYNSDLAWTLNSLALLYSKTNRLKEAEESYHEALKIRRGLVKTNPAAYNSDLASILNSLAILYSKTNRLQEAEESYNEVVKIRRGLVKTNSAAYNSDLASILNSLAILYSKTNRLQEAEELYNEALKIKRDLVKTNPAVYNSGLAWTLNCLALLYSKTNRLKEAEKSYNEALKIKRALAKINPAAYNSDLLLVLGNLAKLYSDTHRFKEATELLGEVQKIKKGSFK